MMQAHLAQYFPLGMADVDRPARVERLSVFRGLVDLFLRFAGLRRVVFCHQS